MDVIHEGPFLCSSIQPSSSLMTNTERAFQFLAQASKRIENDTILKNHTVLKANIIEIKKILGNDPTHIQFRHCRDHAVLHDRVASVTQDAHANPGLKKIWNAFLEVMHNIEVRYPDGVQWITLDFSPSICYLDDLKMPSIKITALDLESKISQKDKDAIWEIQKESFGTFETPPRKNFEAWYQNPSHTLLVARDEHTYRIDGLLLSSRRNDLRTLCILARRANAAKRGIGSQLMTAFIDHYVLPTTKVTLCVRESFQAAQELYRKFGFMESGYQTPQKACPMERDLVMTRLPNK